MSEHTDIAALRIGSVSAVRGRLVEIWVDAERNDSHMLYKGEVIANVSVGSFLVIRSGYRSLVVKIEEEQLVEEKLWNSETYRRDIDRNRRTLKCMLVGEFQGTNYRSGVSATPLIGNTAYIPTQSQVSAIYGSHAEGGGEERGLITIGHLNDNESVPYQIDIAKFFSSHIGIFGNTGSGKSYTLTQLYTKLLDRLTDGTTIPENTRFIIFDLNGEYSADNNDVICQPGNKSIYSLILNSPQTASSGDKIPIPASTFKDPEFWSTALEATTKTQAPFISRALRKTRSARIETKDIKKMLDAMLNVPNPKEFDINHIYSFLHGIKELENRHGEPRLSEFDEETEKALNIFRDNLQFVSKHGAVWISPIPSSYETPTASTESRNFQSHPSDDSTTILYPNNKKYKKVIDWAFEQIFPGEVFSIRDDLFSKYYLHFFLEFYSDVANGYATSSFIMPMMNRLRNTLPVLRESFLPIEQEDCYNLSPVTIIDLSRTSRSTMKFIPLVLTRALYKRHKGSYSLASNTLHFLNIIIDEAHNLLSYESSQESEIWRNTRLETFEEIIKEGRKFGVFLTLASQRPHDISPTITSQLHHYMLHRLVNSKDLDAVRNAVSYLDRKSFDELPALPTGTCVISGTSIQLPAVVKIDPLEHGRTPKNETIDLRNLWNL